MKVPTLQAALGTALIVATDAAARSHGHGHLHAHQLFTKLHEQHRRELHQSAAEHGAVSESGIEKRATCEFPTDSNIVAVPGEKNGGFAIAPDRACMSGTWCPYACKPGMVMAQWEKGSRFTVGSSMNGGLYCDNGVLKKPFEEKPLCVEGTGTVAVQNDCGSVVSFCQTTLPGDEAMRIPSVVSSGSSLTIAVPGPSYWDQTSAHYYVNPPGVDKTEGCVWGTSAKNVGNWSPLIAGANTVANGDTFLTLGWNPEYLRDHPGKMPTYGMKVECSGSCVGSCEINPSKGDFGAVISGNAGKGDVGNKYCVVTVPKGSSATIKVFSLDGSLAKSESKPKESEKPSSSAPPPPPPPPSTTSSPPPAPTTTSTISVAPTASTISSSSSVPPPVPSTIRGGIFHENGTDTSMMGTGTSGRLVPTPSQTFNAPTKAPEPTTNRNEGTPRHGGAAFAGLVIALVASFWLC